MGFVYIRNTKNDQYIFQPNIPSKNVYFRTFKKSMYALHIPILYQDLLKKNYVRFYLRILKLNQTALNKS